LITAKGLGGTYGPSLIVMKSARGFRFHCSDAGGSGIRPLTSDSPFVRTLFPDLITAGLATLLPGYAAYSEYPGRAARLS